jgi:hypothetical protein
MKFACLASLLTATLLLGACASEKAAPAAPAASMGVINTTCPISGEALEGKYPSVQFQGKKVGFCCNKCIAKFEKLDDTAKAADVAKAAK